MTFLLVLFSFAAGAAEGPSVDPSSLPAHWFLRDASEFAKLGVTGQTLVYQPSAGAPPLATVQILARPPAKPLTNRVRDWTAEIVRAKGSYEFLTKPTLTHRDGREVYSAELRADSDSDAQHYLAVEAILVDGNLLILFVDQTRDYYRAGRPAVRALFDVVRAK